MLKGLVFEVFSAILNHLERVDALYVVVCNDRGIRTCILGQERLAFAFLIAFIFIVGEILKNDGVFLVVADIFLHG